MMNIKSFVFLDSETTGLPAYEYNKTKITELCLTSAQAEHISLGVIPRVQNKITLCFNPQKRIQPQAKTITKLYNDELVNESSINDVSLNLLINFLDRLQKPICFVAHDEYKFDYPILRNHIDKVGLPFPEDILCIDSLRALREILNNQNTNKQAIEFKEKTETNTKENNLTELVDEWDDILYNEVLKIEETICETTPNSSKSQILNETTPPVKKQCSVPAAPKHRRIINSASSLSTVQRRLDFDQKTTKQSFSLSNSYERLTEKSPFNVHQAEEDVKMTLECIVHLGDTFIKYANENAIYFNQIPKMQPGVKIGDIP